MRFVPLLLLLFLVSLCKQNNPTTPAQSYIVKASGGLNMRSKPAADAPVVLLLPEGAKVDVLSTNPETVSVAGRTGHWMEISFQDKRGWAFSAFLVKATPASSPQQRDGCLDLSEQFPDSFQSGTLPLQIPFGVGICNLRLDASSEVSFQCEGMWSGAEAGHWKRTAERVEITINAGEVDYTICQQTGESYPAVDNPAARTKCDAIDRGAVHIYHLTSNPISLKATTVPGQEYLRFGGVSRSIACVQP